MSLLVHYHIGNGWPNELRGVDVFDKIFLV
jgi:hypothetical protein